MFMPFRRDMHMQSVEEYCPQNKNEWRAWLEENHDKVSAIWLVFYKKKSINYNLSWSEAVDEALCFGWIDSVKKSIDHEKSKQYFTKRKEKSNWSQVNKLKIEILIKKKLMRKAGYASIEIAKKNGSWNILDEIEALIVPDDLQKEFANYPGAEEYFNNLNKSSKKMLLYWIVSAKRAETRSKRILDVAQNAGRCLKPKQFL
jgi:uncharacterized protein YdeI (YjbR/CyaY-like superfamily)